MIINTWAVSLMRYGAGIVKWTKSEFDEIDRKTRKAMAMNKELHPRSYVDKLHASRMEGARGLIGCKTCAIEEGNCLGSYVRHHIELLIVPVRISNLVHSENSIQLKRFKKQDNEERPNTCRWKAMRGQYVRKIEDKGKSNTWKGLRKSNLKA